ARVRLGDMSRTSVTSAVLMNHPLSADGAKLYGQREYGQLSCQHAAAGGGSILLRGEFTHREGVGARAALGGGWGDDVVARVGGHGEDESRPAVEPAAVAGLGHGLALAVLQAQARIELPSFHVDQVRPAGLQRKGVAGRPLPGAHPATVLRLRVA